MAINAGELEAAVSEQVSALIALKEAKSRATAATDRVAALVRGFTP